MRAALRQLTAISLGDLSLLTILGVEVVSGLVSFVRVDGSLRDFRLGNLPWVQSRYVKAHWLLLYAG